MSDPQPPADPAPQPPPAPAPEPPPAPAPPQPPAPAPAPQSGVLDTLVNTVQGLVVSVAKLQPDDSKPVKKPWTHWGSRS
jgi:hypothetical protein